MRMTHVVGLVAAIGGMVLVGCDDNRTISPQPTPTTSDFEAFAQSLVVKSSCDTFIPADTNSVDFTFAADQDTAEPRDVSTVSAGCSG